MGGGPSRSRSSSRSGWDPGRRGGAAEDGAERRRVALCIGIDDYAEPLAALNTCVKDAADMAQLCEDMGFETSVLNNSSRAKINDQVMTKMDNVEPGGDANGTLNGLAWEADDVLTELASDGARPETCWKLPQYDAFMAETAWAYYNWAVADPMVVGIVIWPGWVDWMPV